MTVSTATADAFEQLDDVISEYEIRAKRRTLTGYAFGMTTDALEAAIKHRLAAQTAAAKGQAIEAGYWIDRMKAATEAARVYMAIQ